MKPSTKAVLFSALLFPGTGHFIAKHPWRGCAWIAVAALALVAVVRQAMAQALDIADKVQSGAIPLDPQAIENAAQQASATQNDLFGYVLLACWIVATIDAYRCARPLDTDSANPVAH